MKHKIFTIFDTKAKAYLPPFFLPEQGMAIRVFADCVNDPNHQFSKHPADYTLFCIGAWADNTASLIANAAPINLGVGVEFIEEKTLAPDLSGANNQEQQA
ncbi:MAG: nonstructural protein [Gammaproteobacteria bacterium]|nr:MAG: nonstructural protein [Gammaproteobacteria bacterium]